MNLLNVLAVIGAVLIVLLHIRLILRNDGGGDGSGIERFDNKKGKMSADGRDYTDNEVKIYKRVFNDKNYIKYNIDKIAGVIGKKDSYNILEAGCGIGADTALIKSLISDKVISVDKSANFIKHFNYAMPNCQTKLGNLSYDKLFQKAQFDIILALHNTLYMNRVAEIRGIIENFSKWIKPNGILVIHIYNKKMLDPAPREFSQYYDNKTSGRKHALTHFDEFIHDSYWTEDDKDKDKNTMYYNEKIVFRKSGHVNRNKHKLYFPDASVIRGYLKKNGFSFVKDISLKEIQVNDVVIAIFKKDA